MYEKTRYVTHGRAKPGFGARKKEILDEMRQLNADLTHHVIMGNRENMTVIRNRIEALDAELNEILIG